MTSRTLALLLVTGIVCTGCATTVPYQSLTRPADAQCEGQSECDVPVDPLNGMVAENMIMSRGRTTVLKWSLNGHQGRYRWDGAGIVFESAAGSVIRCPAGQAGPVRTCTNNGSLGTTSGKFKYDVRVRDTQTNQILVLDPFVLNR
jgi:hypothetical protein